MLIPSNSSRKLLGLISKTDIRTRVTSRFFLMLSLALIFLGAVNVFSIDLDGLPVLGSTKVSDYAMREAAWIVRHMVAERPEILKTLSANGARLVVMAYNEYTTDLPEQADLKPKEYWDKRARGLGGQISSCAEENLLCFPTDPYSTENILIHEFGHTIADYALTKLTPDFHKRLMQAFEKATKAGLWKGTYAGTNPSEY